MAATKKRNFYKSGSSGKKTLKRTIRPTYKKPQEPVEEVFSMSFNKEETEDIPTPRLASDRPSIMDRLKQEEFPKETAPSPVASTQEPAESTDAEGTGRTQSEIDEITRMIQQASAKLKELEEQKVKEEQLAAEAAKQEVVEEFNGVDSPSEELLLLQEELKNYQKQNKNLKHEMDLLKEEFEKEKKHLEKTVKDLKSELHQTTPIQDNKFFSFSKELREAVQAIEGISSEPLIEKKNTVVLRADDPEPVSSTTLTQTEPRTPPIEPKQLDVPVEPTKIVTPEEPPKPEATPATPETTPQTAPAEPEKTPEAQPTTEATPQTPTPSPDKKKEKKLLVTGMVLLGVMLTGGLVSFKLTAKPKVNEKLVEEYLQNNSGGIVQGAQSPQAYVPNGIVADKNSDASFEESIWETYEDPALGFRVEYPANVVERLHTQKSVTFLRKDSYVFKIQKIVTDQELEDYLASTQSSEIEYLVEDVKFNGRDAKHVIPIDDLEFPGNKYVMKVVDSIFEVWYATPSDKFSEDDMKRVDKMLESVNITY